MNSAITSVLLNCALAFVLAFGSVLIIAVVARYVGGCFATDRASRIGAFGVAIGYALGRFPSGAASAFQELPAVSAPLGAIAALMVAWAWLLRKANRNLSELDR